MTTTLLTSLDRQTAQMLIIGMTETLKTLRLAIQRPQGKPKAAKVAEFARLNAQRVALIQEHGLETWAATLAA